MPSYFVGTRFPVIAVRGLGMESHIAHMSGILSRAEDSWPDFISKLYHNSSGIIQIKIAREKNQEQVIGIIQELTVIGDYDGISAIGTIAVGFDENFDKFDWEWEIYGSVSDNESGDFRISEVYLIGTLADPPGPSSKKPLGERQ